jgi:hypothetical protein
MRRHAVILAVAAAWLIGIGRAEAKLDILVDKATQRMMVMQDGYMRYIWPVSTGRDELATPNGIYAPQRLERSWFSRAYYNSPMPYSIFFYNGYAIHGSYAIDQLGGPASHGCVRLHPHHAALLFDLVQQEGPANTTIEITDVQRPEESAVPPREMAMGRSLDPPALSREIVPPREVAMGRGVDPLVPSREIVPPREVAMGRGVDPLVPSRETVPPREIAMVRSAEPPMPPREVLQPREIAAERGPYPPVPPMTRIVRYREPVELAELSPQRGNRPIMARNAAPPPPPPPRPPSVRRALADSRQPASTARAPCGDSETTGGQGSSDCRAKPKAAEGAQPEQTKQAQLVYGFKLLPASCWSGGASRWRWWGSSAVGGCK